MPASAGTKPGALSLVEAGALGDKKKSPHLRALFFFGECAAGRKRGDMHRGHSEKQGRAWRLRHDAGTRTPASAGHLRTVAARKPCEHGGGHNEQADRRHASDA